MPRGIFPPFWHPAFSEGFILDWDGVLAETKLNFAPLRAKYFGGKFVPLYEAAESLPPPMREALKQEIYDLEMEGADKAEPVPGAHELLEWITARRMPWCVVSRNCLDSIRLAAERCSILLPQVVRSRDVPPIKPEPEALWLAAGSLGVPPTECVMVGDFVFDLVGARRAGMRAVLVQRPQAEWKHWADASFDRLWDLLRSLEAPEPLVPWEYAPLAEEIGRTSLESVSRILAVLPAAHPRLLPMGLSLATRGVLHFEVDSAAVLSPEQWRNLPGLAPSWLDQPLHRVLAALLQARFPMAAVNCGMEGLLRMAPGQELDGMLGGTAQ